MHDSPESSSVELTSLIEAARSARERAYAPYSKYLVGAAVRGENGEIFAGCNVENASYGATLCAERAAVSAMIAAGVRKLTAVAVFTDGDPLGMPCGICRQTLMEFAAPDGVVVVASPRERKQTTLAALLPHPFVLRS